MVAVLNLVTNEEAPFYRQQVDALEDAGVTCDELAVSGQYRPERGESRTVLDYLRLYPRVLERSFGRYDLIHANQALTAPLALAQPTLPVVVSVWGLELRNQFELVTRCCARLADAVIVMSDEMAGELDRDCHVIPHGVDLEMFAPASKERAQRRLGWDRGKRHVLFPYETAREEKDFPRTKRLVAATRERLRAPVVLHTPHPVPHGSMPVYLNASDALLVTSTSEGSPNVVKEALACNVPVVSTDVGDVRRLVDGIAQSHVRRSDSDLVDALVSVLEAGRRADGRSRAEDLSVGRMADRILAVYERILVDP